MDDDLYLEFSTLAYEPKKETHRGYILDKQHSTDEHRTYHDPINKKVVIAYRGTHTLKDIITDYNLIQGKLDKRFDDSLKVAQNVKDKYKDYKITTTGHSLSGALSIHVNKKLGIDSIVYNPAPIDIFKPLNSNVKIIREKRDIVSLPFAFSPNTINKNTKRNIINAHKIKSFF